MKHEPRPDQATAVTLEAWRAAGARTLSRLDELSAHYATVYGIPVEEQQTRARAFVRAWEVVSPIITKEDQMRIKTRIEDRDTDEHGEERVIPAGTSGTVTEWNGETSVIEWDNGAVTSWTPEEIARDADILSPVEEVRQAIEQREANAGDLVDVPFSLTPPVSERKGFQTRMF